MKRCYLQKKFTQIFSILERHEWLLYGIHELHCDKNTLFSIFKWLVPWKQDLPGPKFSFENLSPSPTLSCTITKKPKNFVVQKSLKVLKLLRIFIDSIVFRFNSDRTLFRFPIDRILFRVLSDRVFSESSVIGCSSGSTVLLGYQCSFSAMWLFFLSNRAAIFLSKPDASFYIIV